MHRHHQHQQKRQGGQKHPALWGEARQHRQRDAQHHNGGSENDMESFAGIGGILDVLDGPLDVGAVDDSRPRGQIVAEPQPAGDGGDRHQGGQQPESRRRNARADGNLIAGIVQGLEQGDRPDRAFTLGGGGNVRPRNPLHDDGVGGDGAADRQPQRRRRQCQHKPRHQQMHFTLRRIELDFLPQILRPVRGIGQHVELSLNGKSKPIDHLSAVPAAIDHQTDGDDEHQQRRDAENFPPGIAGAEPHDGGEERKPVAAELSRT